MEGENKPRLRIGHTAGYIWSRRRVMVVYTPRELMLAEPTSASPHCSTKREARFLAFSYCWGRRHIHVKASLLCCSPLRRTHILCTAQGEHPVKCSQHVHGAADEVQVRRDGWRLAGARSQAPVSAAWRVAVSWTGCAMARELLRLCWLRRLLEWPRVGEGRVHASPSCTAAK
jgi:hypothetical protein